MTYHIEKQKSSECCSSKPISLVFIQHCSAEVFGFQYITLLTWSATTLKQQTNTNLSLCSGSHQCYNCYGTATTKNPQYLISLFSHTFTCRIHWWCSKISPPESSTIVLHHEPKCFKIHEFYLENWWLKEEQAADGNACSSPRWP
jgi:hypothetical protein